MSETEWTLIKSEIDFLWPFKAAIDYLESDTKPTTPSVIPIFEKLHNVIKNRLDDLGQEMQKKVLAFRVF